MTYKGHAKVLCMESPVQNVIIGNIPGALGLGFRLCISNLSDSDSDADASHNHSQITHLTAKYMHRITIYLRPHILNTELDEKFSSNSVFSLHGRK